MPNISTYLGKLPLDKSFLLFFAFLVQGLELKAYTLSHSTSPFL
jgi:hypothetical protein